MLVEVVTIPVAELRVIVADAVAKGIQLAKQQDVLEDVFISVSEASEIMGVGSQTIISMCDRDLLKHKTILGNERKDGKKPKRTITISKNSIVKFLNNKR